MIQAKFLTNLSWLFLDKLLRILGGLFIGIWVARYLGPHDFGVLNFALAYTALFLIFVKLGLDQILVRELVTSPEQSSKLLGSAFGLKFIGSLVAIAAVYLSFYFVHIDSLTKTIILILSIYFISLSLDVIDFFFSRESSRNTLSLQETALSFSPV